MSNLTKFLLARIAEDEAVARKAETWPFEHAIQDSTIPEDYPPPHRVLAECAAKRRIVELHSGDAEWCGWTQGGDGTHADMGDDCDTLLALAQPYADHPDFDPAWRLE